MNVGIISDVHGNYKALKKIVIDMEKHSIDYVIVLGDILFGSSDDIEPQKCFDVIKELEPIAWLKGNTDEWFNFIDEDYEAETESDRKKVKKVLSIKHNLDNEVLEKFKELSDKQEVMIDDKRILCVHGSDRKIVEQIGIMRSSEEINDLINRLEQDILLCGHTHKPFIVSKNNKLVMNVGSVGLPMDEVRSSYGILKFEDGNFEYSIRRIK